MHSLLRGLLIRRCQMPGAATAPIPDYAPVIIYHRDLHRAAGRPRAKQAGYGRATDDRWAGKQTAATFSSTRQDALPRSNRPFSQTGSTAPDATQATKGLRRNKRIAMP
jgi:hypothetical protein